MSAADRLRANVKAWASTRGRQAKLARDLSVKESSITKWLSGGNTTLDVDAIAASTGLDLSELFGPVQESDRRNSPVTPIGPQSASNAQTGDAHGAEIGLLKQQLTELQAEYDQFAAEVGGAVQYFGSLVAKKAEKAAQRESLARHNDRTHDRQLPRARTTRRQR